MNAEVPIGKIFIKAFIPVVILFSVLFFSLFCFLFMQSYANSEEIDIDLIINFVKMYVLVTCSYIILYFLIMLYYHNVIRNKIINLDYVITKITEKKFYFKKDNLKYTLEVVYSKSMRLILYSKDNKINTTFYSVNDLEKELTKLEV